MISASSQIVWTPIIGHDYLKIVLRRDFAEACLKHKATQPNFTNVVGSFMLGSPAALASNFLVLHEDTILVQGLYTGRNGVWLTLDTSTITSMVRPFTYNGHNEDSWADKFWLLQAFGAWADVATNVLKWK